MKSSRTSPKRAETERAYIHFFFLLPLTDVASLFRRAWWRPAAGGRNRCAAAFSFLDRAFWRIALAERQRASQTGVEIERPRDRGLLRKPEPPLQTSFPPSLSLSLVADRFSAAVRFRAYQNKEGTVPVRRGYDEKGRTTGHAPAALLPLYHGMDSGRACVPPLRHVSRCFLCPFFFSFSLF